MKTPTENPDAEAIRAQVREGYGKMKNEQKTKKGFFGILRESFSKTGAGCCCGPGETCGGPPKESDKAQTKETRASKAAGKPAQK